MCGGVWSGVTSSLSTIAFISPSVLPGGGCKTVNRARKSKQSSDDRVASPLSLPLHLRARALDVSLLSGVKLGIPDSVSEDM